MIAPPLSQVLLLLLLLLLQAFISAAHYAFESSSRRWLKEHTPEGVRAQRALQLMERTEDLQNFQHYLSIVLSMGISVLLINLIATPLSTELVGAGLTPFWATLLANVLLLLTAALGVLWVGYQLPIEIVAGRSEQTALYTAFWIRLPLMLLNPFFKLTHNLSRRVGKMLGGSGKPIHVTEEEIKSLVSEGSKEGSIEAEEKTMIYSVFRFGDTLVREVMVPRTDIVAIDINTSLEQALSTIITAGHSRIPVYEGSIDNIKGFLYAKDLLVFWLEKRTHYDLQELLRTPYYVPASKKVDELLEEFQERETHIAVVNDEYGGTAGLVTLEDLLEQLVGDIRDEYDFYEETAYERVSNDEYIVLAWIDLDDLNEMLEIALPTDDYDTLGGYIFSELGKIPEVGDAVQAQGYNLEVLSLKGERRIHQVRVSKLKPEPENESPDSVESTTLPKEKAIEHES